MSGTDVETQRSNEQLNARAVGIVVDPVKSVKGKIVLDAFRSISQQTMMMQMEPRQTTSNLYHIKEVNRAAYSLGLN